MPNKVGDILTSSIQRGGWIDVIVTIDRGGGAGNEDESLRPALDGTFREKQVYDEGLSGQIDVKYYTRELRIDYVQTDSETLADLYASALDSQFHEAGVPLELTFRNGTTKTLTMYATRELHNDGPSGHTGVIMSFKSYSLTPLMR